MAETILYDHTRRRIDIGDADEGGGGSTVLSKFSNPPDWTLCDYVDTASLHIGYILRRRSNGGNGRAAPCSGSLLHPRQAEALWGRTKAGDRRLQWHLLQISIWITIPLIYSLSPPPYLVPSSAYPGLMPCSISLDLFLRISICISLSLFISFTTLLLHLGVLLAPESCPPLEGRTSE